MNDVLKKGLIIFTKSHSVVKFCAVGLENLLGKF